MTDGGDSVAARELERDVRQVLMPHEVKTGRWAEGGFYEPVELGGDKNGAVVRVLVQAAVLLLCGVCYPKPEASC